MPHDERAAVAPSDKSIIATAVYLQLIVVEAMNQVPSDETMRQGITVYCRERKRRVRIQREVRLANLEFAMVGSLLAGQKALPNGRQVRQLASVPISLLESLSSDPRKRLLKSRKVSEEVIKAAVFGVDDYNRVDGFSQHSICLRQFSPCRVSR